MSLKNIVSKLNTELTYLKWAKNISAEELEKIIAHVETVVNQIDLAISASPQPLTKQVQMSIHKTLQELDDVLKASHAQNQKVQQVSEKLLQVQTHLEEHSRQRAIALKTELKIGFYCDVDSPDYNKAIVSDIYGSLDQGIPFITTRSLLRQTGLVEEPGENFLNEMIRMEDTLLAKESDWSIYEHKGFLVFLPQALAPAKLDFDEATLKQITVRQALEESGASAEIEALPELFVKAPTVGKLFFLSGHGNQTSVGGLKAENYQKFLKMLDEIGCMGLSICSCYSGGQSSFFSISEDTPHPFPIIAHSIGELPAYKTTEEIRRYFDELEQFLSGKEPKTPKGLRKRMEKGGVGTDLTNLTQVYFPHSAKVPGGFRSVGEYGLAEVITYADSKREELLSKGVLKKPKKAAREIANKQVLEIYPTVVRTPLIFKGKDPFLFSKIPGDSRHFLQSVKLTGGLKSFMEETITLHQEIGTQKAFFIGDVEDAQGVHYSEVILFLSHGACQYVYREGAKFYADGKEISELEHAAFYLAAEEETRPEPRALRVSSAGQETEMTFQEAAAIEFWTHKSPVTTFLLTFDPSKQADLDRLKRFDKTYIASLPPPKKEAAYVTLAFFLLEWGTEEAFKVAMPLFSQLVDPDSQNLLGVPIIFKAIQTQYLPLIQEMMAQGVDLNVSNPQNHKKTPLHEAVETRNLKLVRTLCADPSVLVDAKDDEEWTSLFYAVHSNQIFEFLLKKGANIDAISKTGETIMSLYLKTPLEQDYKGKIIDYLIVKKASSNAGKPSAMTIACSQFNWGMVLKLKFHGLGEPFKKDPSGKIPFVEACLRGSSPIVSYLIGQANSLAELQEADAQGLTPIFAALMSGNPSKIESLRKRGVPFPKLMTDTCETAFLHFLKRAKNTNNFKSLETVLEWNEGACEDIETILIKTFRANPDLIRDFQNKGLFKSKGS